MSVHQPDRRWRRSVGGVVAGDPPSPRGPRASYEDYLAAAALTLAGRHRPVWCWRRWRRVCRCGAILAVHVRGLDGMCVGCRAWWARLTPYPCWQVAWATSRQARARTARFLGVRG
ncbi:hypothetical protein ACFY3U_12140 [Micromonospora sp. NPDC000089]|uniref:hypothetical protein n=1 Tax=unclassified Micromonospora TaxID=2617518 RepID=UPI0036A14716